MNINPDSVNRRESTRPPTPQEREAMRATRERVRTDEVARREVADRAVERTRAEARKQGDRIEISKSARRRIEANKSDGPDHRALVERLRNAYSKGELGNDARFRAAATRMLKGENPGA